MVIIYALRCKVHGTAYIGSTKNKLAKRIREHLGMLRRGEHSEPTLLHDYGLYGPEAFESLILQELPNGCSVSDKRTAELEWMRFYDALDRLYNTRFIAYQGTPESLKKAVSVAHAKPGSRWTAEANLKRSLAQKGKPKGHGAKISATKKALGQRPSLETARKGGIAATKARYKADEIV